MTRIEKKHTYQEQDHPVTNSIFGLMDGVMLKVFRINESELDKICQLATDEELELFTKEDRTIKESRQLLTFLKDKIYVKEPKY
jgi:hypothetical protein